MEKAESVDEAAEGGRKAVQKSCFGTFFFERLARLKTIYWSADSLEKKTMPISRFGVPRAVDFIDFLINFDPGRPI